MKSQIKVSDKETIELTAQQQRFADEYLLSGNATESARVAGYTAKDASSAGSTLLTNSKVLAYIKLRQTEIEKRSVLQRDDIIFHLINIGFTTIDKIMEWNGQDITVKSLDEIPKEALPAIESISQHTIKGQKHIRIKMRDSLKAIDILNRMHGWYADGDLGGKGNTGASKLMAELQEQYRAKLQQGKNVRKVQ